MQPALKLLFVVVVLIAASIVIVDRIQSRSNSNAQTSSSGSAATARAEERLAALEKTLGSTAASVHAIEKRLAVVAAGLVGEQDPSIRRSPDAAAPSTVAQRLEAIEASLFDFERHVRRETRLLYDKTRLRFDELDAKLAAMTAKPRTPEERAKLVEDLATQGVVYDPAKKRFEVKGGFGRPTRVLEFLAVAPGGRSHESLLVLDVVPSAMKKAADDMGIPKGRPADFTTNRAPEGDGLFAYVAWEGRDVPVRVENLVKNMRTGKTLKPGPLVYIGSRDIVKEVSWDVFFAADVYYNVVGLTWNFSGDMVFNAADEEGVDEHVWVVNEEVAPPPETPCRMIFSKEPVAEWEKN
jgi:hypothetical protein